jgi:hypothetical protein
MHAYVSECVQSTYVSHPRGCGSVTSTSTPDTCQDPDPIGVWEVVGNERKPAQELTARRCGVPPSCLPHSL